MSKEVQLYFINAHTHTHTHTRLCVCVYIYIYIYIYIIQCSKSERGNNSNQDKKNIQKRMLNLNNPGKELNVNKIHWANNFFLKNFKIYFNAFFCFFFFFFFFFFLNIYISCMHISLKVTDKDLVLRFFFCFLLVFSC